MVQSKRAFEVYIHKVGVKIRHHHSKNGLFQENAFMKPVKDEIQMTSFCEINANFQNVKIEIKINNLQEQARKQLHHAKAGRKSALDISQFSYYSRKENRTWNFLPDQEYGTTPLDCFTWSTISPKLRYNHVFWCPLYALQYCLQTGGRISKWNPRARMGLYMGPSPRHMRLLYLVLNLEAAMVSPQLHFQHANFFEIFCPTLGNTPTISEWKHFPGLSIKRDISSRSSSRDQIPMRSFQTSNRNSYHHRNIGRNFRSPRDNKRGTQYNKKNQGQEIIKIRLYPEDL